IEGESRALLFERDRLTWMRSGQKAPANLYAPDHLPMPTAVSTWTTTATEPNPLQRCPISAVALRRSPRDTVGRSDLAPLLPIQAALDKAVVDAMTLSEAAAAPRRWATGVEIPTDPDTGATVDPFTSAAGTAPSITIAEDPAARLGSFPAADLSGTLATIEALRSDLLARAAVPPHLAVGAASGQMVSAESIRSAEASLVTRVRDRQRLLGDGIGRAVRLASEVATGRPEAFVVPTWADPATSTVAADADAAVKLLGAGIPPAAVLSAVLGWTPDQVAAATSAPTDERPV
ncbi:MAG: phage portal protein, partial [Iamia sp.]